MKKWLLFILLINLTSVNGQLLKKNQTKLGLTVGYILSPKPNAALLPSAEFKFNNNWAAFVEIGFPISATQNDSSAINSKFFRIKNEIRYYGNRKSYIGFQLGIAFRNFDVLNSNTFYESQKASSKFYNYDAANIQSNIYTSTMQVGRSVMIFKQVGLDLSGGLGARIINTNYRKVINQVESTRPRGFFNFNGNKQAYYYNSNVYRLQFNIALRLFYTL